MLESKPRPAELFKQLRDPVMLLTLFNEAIRTKKRTLHTWQIQEMLRFAKAREKGKRIQMAIVANNGSGKSSHLIAPCAMWLATHFKRGRSVVTSSSGQQLDKQTGASIAHLAEQVNSFYDGEEVIKIRERFYTPMFNGGTLEMFATDEAGKAEGYHPFEDGDGELGFFCDEGKSIGEHIYTAIARCTITRRLDVSSPGKPQGHFFDSFTMPTWESRRITYKDCPHINPETVEEDRIRYGEHSPLFRSKHLAEFTSEDEQVVISFDTARRWFSNVYQNKESYFGEPFAGVDLAAGGDESVFSLWHGNKQITQEAFRFSNTQDTVRYLITLFRKYNLQSENITLDDGGLGRVMNDQFAESGFAGIRRIRNESKALDQMYMNRGAENYFNLARIGDKLLWLPDDKLKNQVSSRYYDIINGKPKLEDKRKARAQGHKSPDRADAAVLAFVGRWDNYLFAHEDREQMLGSSKRVPERLTSSELLELMEREKFERVMSARVETVTRGLGKTNYRRVLEARIADSRIIRPS